MTVTLITDQMLKIVSAAMINYKVYTQTQFCGGAWCLFLVAFDAKQTLD